MAEQLDQGQSTQTVRIAFLEEPHYRSTDTTKDNRFVNGYFEPITNQVKRKIDFFFTKRPGLSQNVRPSGGNAVGRGVFVWNGNIYSVFGTQIYKNSTNLGVTMTTSTGLVKFCLTRPGAATQYLCINDGVKLFCINSSGTVTTVTTNFPANTRDIVFLDQYILVLDTSANLWNSSPDDPTAWDGISNITAQMMPGTGVGLYRQANYVCAFTDQHMQCFYDNANASGSPLSNADTTMKRFGCISNDTIATLEQRTFWVGNSQNGSYTVWMMEGLSDPKDVGTDTINRIIGLEGSSITSARAFTVRVAGHAFYVLTLSSANRTFVYDPDIQVWCEWTDTTGSNSWPIVAVAEKSGQPIVQHATNGWIYNLSPSVFQDDGVNFTITARTPREDFDTMKRKFVDRLDLVADQQTSVENITISYTDDDYQTFSTGRTFDISRARNFGRVWGNFRRRSWQLQYTGNQAFRCFGFEIVVTVEL